MPTQYPVAISGATTNKTIVLSAPTSYINVTVQASGGTAIGGAPVFANVANGNNEFGNAMTGSNGTTKIYVPAGTYSVRGFAPAFGPLAVQTVTVTNASNPSVIFTVNTGSLKTISGTVTQGSVGVSGINIGAHGTGSTSGGNNTQTDSKGAYALYVPAGTYQIGGWSQTTGGLSPQNVDVSSSDANGVNWSLGVQGTLHLTIHNASSISPLFAGAFNPTTGKGNGTNSWTTNGTDKVADISLPAGTYNVRAGSPSLGSFGNQTSVAVSGGGTTNVTFDTQASTTLVTLSGSVTLSGTGVGNVNVWASRVDVPGFFSTQTDSSGNYSLTVPDATTYHVGVRSLAYIANQGDVDVPVSGNTTRNFTVATAGAIITGKVLDSNGTGIANAWVTAIKTGVASTTQVGAPTDAAGNYSLNVDTGSTWSLTAQGPCYLPSIAVAASAGNTSKNITLTAQGGCSVPIPDVNAITASSGGQISNSGMTLNIPANALGSSQSSVNVSISNAANVVSSTNATPLKGSVKSITATNASGQYITSLNNNASLSITYDPSELPVGFDQSKLQLGYFNEATGQWEPVAATIDTLKHTLTAQVKHFTQYGPILPGVPDAPTGLTATVASATSINLSWTASPAAVSYIVYRSSTNSGFTTSIATGVTSTSYSNSGLSASTKYYYEIAGVNSSGEGPNSSSVNVTTNAVVAVSSSGGGGFAPVIGSSGTPNPLPGSISSAPSVAVASPIATAVTPSIATAVAVPSSVIPLTLTRSLSRGARGDDVTALQSYLEARGYLTIPFGVAKGYFGPLTKAAVTMFQKDVGIDPIGIVGPLTRAALKQETSIPTNLSSAATSNTKYTFMRSLTFGMKGNDVMQLQIVLNRDPDTNVALSGPGSAGYETEYFGNLTENAVKNFQEKYGIVSSGTPTTTGYGRFGPKTRAKLNALATATTSR